MLPSPMYASFGDSVPTLGVSQRVKGERLHGRKRMRSQMLLLSRPEGYKTKPEE